MPESGVCRNEACGQDGPLQPDGYCSQACREEAAVRRHIEAIRAGMVARDAWIREQLLGLAPLAAAERLREILQAEEAQELAGGYRHLTVVHGDLERDRDGELLERLLEAMCTACAGRDGHWTSHKHRFTLTVGPPDADLVVTRLAALARELAEAAVATGGWRWQVALVKPRGSDGERRRAPTSTTGRTCRCSPGWACLAVPLLATPNRVKGAR